MKTYNIREIGQIFDVPSSTLRYYEELGILPEVKRDEHKQRVYTDEHIDRLQAITCFKRTGLPMSKIHDFFEYAENLRDNIDKVVDMMENHEKYIVDQMEKMQQDLDHIRQKVRFYNGIKKAIEKDEFFVGHSAVQMDIGAKVLPHFVKDNTDRNRTSPFAFTGNKFEFRMLGSSSSVANPNIILNTAVAESLRQFYEKLKDVPADEMESAVHELLKQTIIDHKRVIFNGNGYTDEWLEEAKKRGLYNLVSTPDALPHLIDEKNAKLLTSHHIFTDAELHSRYEIKLDNYVKTLHIEANTLVEIIQKDLLPSITTYMEKLAQTASLKKSVVPGISVSAEASLLSRLTELAETMTKDLETLKADTAMAEYEVDKDLLKSAKLYQSVVLTDMEKVRVSADAAEALIPDSILPYPTYGKLLFSISD